MMGVDLTVWLRNVTDFTVVGDMGQEGWGDGVFFRGWGDRGGERGGGEGRGEGGRV